eukprot:9123716-Alexandrium_andersonii.AAC.1
MRRQRLGVLHCEQEEVRHGEALEHAGRKRWGGRGHRAPERLQGQRHHPWAVPEARVPAG